jgi:uncharacterized membrane protein
MTAGNPDASLDATVFDAVLTPHRSLGRTGFRLLLCAVCAASTLMSVPFYLLGAWPVIGFFGLDVALLYLFFRLNYRDGRAQERVLLTYLNLFVSRIDPVGRRSEWRFNPLWVRLERDEHADFGLTRPPGTAFGAARIIGFGWAGTASFITFGTTSEVFHADVPSRFAARAPARDERAGARRL